MSDLVRNKDLKTRIRFSTSVDIKLAEKLEISLKYISRIENGNSGIKTQTLIKYINILGINPNLIFKDFINNEKLKPQVELTIKLDNLSEDNIILLNSIADLLIKFQ